MEGRRQAGVWAIIALIAVGIYSISCKPAWDPEGGRVAHICVRDVDGESRYAVALYDLVSEENQYVAEEDTGKDGTRLVPIEVFWPERGNELIVVSAPEDKNKTGTVRISAYDLQKKTTRRIQDAAVPGVTAASSLAPMVLQGKRWLWLLGDDDGPVFRVDLKKGGVTELTQAQLLLDGGGKVFYVAEGPDDGLVFGKVKTLFGLKKKPLFTVPGQDGADFAPVAAMPSRTRRFACVKSRQGMNTLIVFDDGGRCIKRIVLSDPIGLDDVSGGAEWNPDGTVLWMAMEGKDEAENGYNGIAEINIADGSVKIIKVNEDNRYGDLKPLQIALSPDEAHLAVSMLGDEELRLCLVDLKSGEREVTLVPLPESAAPPAAK